MRLKSIQRSPKTGILILPETEAIQFQPNSVQTSNLGPELITEFLDHVAPVIMTEDKKVLKCRVLDLSRPSNQLLTLMQYHFRFYVQNGYKYGFNCLPSVSVLLDFEEVSRLDKCSYTRQDLNKVSPTTERIRPRPLRRDLSK